MKPLESCLLVFLFISMAVTQLVQDYPEVCDLKSAIIPGHFNCFWAFHLHLKCYVTDYSQENDYADWLMEEQAFIVNILSSNKKDGGEEKNYAGFRLHYIHLT